MRSLTSALGLLCLLAGTGWVHAAPAAPISPELEARSIPFNPRQKWQRDELNCVQILTPSPGATYEPGFFVRVNYGTGQCNGIEAATPWTIHLYNNPEVHGNKVSFDYHEVIADKIHEGTMQYVWNIPTNQVSKAEKVRKPTDYYVRVETHSRDGVKLVGNAGPFTINGLNAPRRFKVQAKDEDAPLRSELKRREESGPSEFSADFALVHKDPLRATVNKENHGPSASVEVAVPEANPVSGQPPAPATEMAQPAPNAAPVNTEPVTNSSVVLTTEDAAPAMNGSAATPPNQITAPNQITYLTTQPNTLDGPKQEVTEISHRSIVPSTAIVAGTVAGGALAVGYLGGSFFGQVGSVIGAVLGGVVGTVALVFGVFGVPI